MEFGAAGRPGQWTIGADAALDTRGDPAFPANAVYCRGGWNALQRGSASTAINRYTVDGRGYLRLLRPAGARRPRALPDRRRHAAALRALLIGGSSSLRGFRTGAFDGDKTLSTSAELRMPITSVISGAKLGVDGLRGRRQDRRLRREAVDDSNWRRGAGAGLFLIASVVKLNLDVAHGFDGGGTRVHLSSGFAF